jgi:hypothetical protein
VELELPGGEAFGVVCVSTAPLTAAGLMAAPPGAARGCLWQVPETLPLRQDNGLTVIIHTSNYKVTGRVQYAHTDGR